MAITDVIIPAFNEEKSIGLVLKEIPQDKVRQVVVCNNHSTDRTREVALAHGAMVVDEMNKGYGYACLRAMEHIRHSRPEPDLIVFLDGDHSDYPEQLPELTAPILRDGYDLVIGSRALGHPEKGSMTLPQRFGNWLATHMIRWLYGYRFTDLGPFRAIRYKKLLELNMCDKTYGWTVEMQVKAAKLGFRCTEVPVKYRRRIGVSKVSGTIKGTILAGFKIIWTILKLL